VRARVGLLLALAALIAVGGSSAAGRTSPRAHQSVLFWLAWDGGKLGTIPWDDVTQVNLFSLSTCAGAGKPAADCTGPTSLSTEFNGVTNPRGFVRTVHRHHELALISIGGSDNPNWYYPCNPADVATFASTLVGYMKSNGFDGIDLDIEEDAGTGSPTFTAADLQACAKAVHDDAKAVKTALGRTPLITSDVDPTTNFDIGKIERPYVDQFNAMSYGATGAALGSQIRALERQSEIRPARITAGLDIGDYPPPKSDCVGTARYAASHHLAGAMLWYGQADARHRYSCLRAIATYIR
jgi:GH18 family chitinase